MSLLRCGLLRERRTQAPSSNRRLSSCAFSVYGAMVQSGSAQWGASGSTSDLPDNRAWAACYTPYTLVSTIFCMGRTASSLHRPPCAHGIYPTARRGGLRGAGGISTDSRMAANIEWGWEQPLNFWGGSIGCPCRQAVCWRPCGRKSTRCTTAARAARWEVTCSSPYQCGEPQVSPQR